jgi:hypothetical protein
MPLIIGISDDGKNAPIKGQLNACIGFDFRI